MDLFRAGEMLLRSTQPLLPSVCRTSKRLGGIPIHCRPVPLSRALSTTCSRQQSPAAAAAPPRRRDDGRASSASSSAAAFAFEDLLNSALDGSKGVPTAPTGRPSRFESRDAQQRNREATGSSTVRTFTPRANPSVAQPPDIENSSDEFKFNMSIDPDLSSKPSSSTPSSMMNTISSFGSVSNTFAPFRPPPPPPPTPAPMKLNSSTGRTIPVRPEQGIDPARAFRMLDQRCAQNSVKRDFMRQRFHERDGLKRKRLRRERWRKRFKEGFRETVARVQMMRKQGW